jgi:hypothetical protein
LNTSSTLVPKNRASAIASGKRVALLLNRVDRLPGDTQRACKLPLREIALGSQLPDQVSHIDVKRA